MNDQIKCNVLSGAIPIPEIEFNSIRIYWESTLLITYISFHLNLSVTFDLHDEEMYQLALNSLAFA